MYYRIIDPVKAKYRVQNLTNSVTEMVFAALRQVVGEGTLQQLLDHKEHL